MILLATLCAVCLVAVAAERRQWLVFGTFVIALLGAGAAGAFDPDRFIAEEKLGRYLDGRPLDAGPLTDLSADEVPAVLRALDTPAARGDVAMQNALGIGLHQQLVRLDAAAAASWPAWKLARSDAQRQLAERRAEMERYPLPGCRSTPARLLDASDR